MPHLLPTFARLTEYLLGLGFRHRTRVRDGHLQHVFELPGTRNFFAFPDYPPDVPVPGHAVEPLHAHLVWNEVIPAMSFDDFLDQFAPARAG